jgi:hypothetical protein
MSTRVEKKRFTFLSKFKSEKHWNGDIESPQPKAKADNSSSGQEHASAANQALRAMSPLLTSSNIRQEESRGVARSFSPDLKRSKEKARASSRSKESEYAGEETSKGMRESERRAKKRKKNKQAKKQEENVSDIDTDRSVPLVGLEEKKYRKVWGGGMYKPPPPEDQELKEGEPLPSSYRWVRQKGVLTSDFHTLIRKTVCAVLANQGFIMREIFVDHGDKIALILTLPEENLSTVAEMMGLPRKVEFAMADLLSLEPVDSKYRPLRLNAYLWDENLWGVTYAGNLDKQAAQNILTLRRAIIDLLKKDCNMKQIVRLASAVWHEGKTDVFHHIYNPEQVDIETWRAYFHYLTELAVRIREIEKTSRKLKAIVTLFFDNIVISTHGNIDRRRLNIMEVQKFTSKEVAKAMTACLDNSNGKLKSFWGYLGTEPSEYIYKYMRPDNHMKPRHRNFYSNIWKDYFRYIEKPDKDHGIAAETEKVNAETPDSQPSEDTSEEDKKKYLIYHYKFMKIERLKCIDYLVSSY